MANIFREPLIVIQSTGVTVNPNNTLLRAKTRETLTISIGNDVSTTANPTFLTLTPSNEQFQINQYLIKPNALTGSINLLGNTTVTNDLTVGGNLDILGTTTTAEKIQSSLSQSYTIFESGSTQFGNTSDDTHVVTGSLLSSGSLSIHNYNITDVSDDIYLSIGRSDYLITENGAKEYVDENDNDNLEVYLRKCFAHTGSFVDSDTFTFNAVTASAPIAITSTRVDDFMFFVNGQMMESDALTIQQQGSTLRLDIDSDNIGYDLTNDDEVVAWGKFNS
tara:strand:+ start:512 stop:1345 length:834 start_codon:yes stop_codon:yes gene_type:complete